VLGLIGRGSAGHNAGRDPRYLVGILTSTMPPPDIIMIIYRGDGSHFVADRSTRKLLLPMGQYEAMRRAASAALTAINQ
jgi:hypothetical protein